MSESAGVTDWSVLDEPGVAKVLDQVSRRVARDFYPTIEEGDAEQEATIILGTKAAKARAKLAEGGERFLLKWLREELIRRVQTEVERSSRHVQVDFEEDGSIQEPEHLRGFREDDGVDYPVEVRSQ